MFGMLLSGCIYSNMWEFLTEREESQNIYTILTGFQVSCRLEGLSTQYCINKHISL